MALYVCHKCGGSNQFCTTCWGHRFYTPESEKKDVPTQRTESPEDFDTTLTPSSEETEPTDAST